MTQQVIDIGSAPDDGTGDPLRTSFDKTNENFTELYAKGANEGIWNYNQTTTDTSTSPVSGRFRTNSGNYHDATQIAIHATTIQGIDRTSTLRTLLVGDLIQCQDSTNPAAWCRYSLQSLPVDHGTWFQLNVTLQADSGVASGDNQEIVFVFTANSGSGGGGSYQPLDPTLTSLSDLVGAANTFPYFATTDTFALDVVTPFARGSILSAANAGDARGKIDAAPLDSPTFTGNPTAPTPTAGDTDTSIATTAFVATAISAAATTVTAPQGRLTLQTATPVMTTTQAAKTTIYYSPYVGDLVPIYSGGTNFVMTTIGELSALTTDTTHSPAAIGASKINDWFVWNDAGTVRLSHGPDWTNDTTRSAGTDIGRVNGLWLNMGAITNGPAALRGTYIGTTRSNPSAQMDWIFGYTAAGGGPAVFSVWNCYNRVNVDTQILMTNSSWSLGAGAPGVFAPAAGGSPNMRCSFITGLEEESFEAKYSVTCVATAGAGCSCGIGYDNISAFTYGVAGFAGISNGSPIVGAFAGVAVLGWHFVQAMEHSDSNPGSFYGTLGLPQVQSGMSVSLRM